MAKYSGLDSILNLGLFSDEAKKIKQEKAHLYTTEVSILYFEGGIPTCFEKHFEK